MHKNPEPVVLVVNTDDKSCSFCKAKFDDKKALKEHLSLHTKVRQFSDI